MSTQHKYNENEPVTLTPKEIEESAKKRLELITKEFSEGLNFIQKFEKSVTFFGSSRVVPDNKYYGIAESLAKKIVEKIDYAIVTGGGPGIMEAANKGAKSANGQSIGLPIELPHEQAMNHYLTDYYEFHYFFSRRVCLTFSAEAYVFFPGGFGTFNELFEIMTLIQTNKSQRVPVILFGSDFWKPIDNLIKSSLLEGGFISEQDSSIYTIMDDLDEAVNIIKNAPVRNGERFHSR